MAEQERFAEFVHPLVAVGIPVCFLFTQNALFSRWIPSWPLPSPAALILSAAIGITTVLLGNLFREERLGLSARLRELILLVLILYLGASLTTLFTGNPMNLWTTAFKPSFLNLTVSGLGLLQWVFSVVLQGALRDRELLLKELEGAQGLELQSRLRDMGSLAEDTLRGLGKIRNITRLLLAIILVETLVHGILFPGQSLTENLFILPLFLVYPFMNGLLGRYVREQYDAGAGIAPDRDSRSHQVRGLLALLGLIFVTAFIGAGSSSLLPLQWIQAFFSWLSSLLPKQTPMAPPAPEVLPELPDMEQLQHDLEALGTNQKAPPDLTMLWLTLGIFAAVVAGLFLLFFLVSPLKSRYFWQRLGQVFSPRSLWQGMKKFFSYFKVRKAGPMEALDLDPDNLKQVRQQLERLTAEKPDRRKRAQLGKMMELYLRFLRWGEAMKVPCRPSIAPGEYAELLAARFPDLGEPIHSIASIFEEALYGDTLLTREQWNRFVAAVETVVSYDGERT